MAKHHQQKRPNTCSSLSLRLTLRDFLSLNGPDALSPKRPHTQAKSQNYTQPIKRAYIYFARHFNKTLKNNIRALLFI